MSQKPAKKKGAQKQQIKIVDEQKEPCLRAMQKKVRNINKRLTQIEDLQKKDFLKPEQEEKVNRKQNVLDEKEKYLEFIEMYKGIVKENEEAYRKTQLTELEDLAALIASREYGADVGEKSNASVDSLVKILTAQSLANMTLKERVTQISNALIQTANDQKLKSNVRKYINENEDKTVNAEGMSNEPEPRSPRSERERENEIKQIDEELAEQKEEQKREEEAENQPASEAVETKKEEPTTPNVVSVPEPLEEKAHSAPHDGEKKNEQQKEGQANKADEKNEGNQGKGRNDGRKKYDRGQRDERGGRRTARGGKREGGYRENKKPYKPKYEPKHKEAPKDDASDSSSLSATPEPREFKREEVRELIEDGFIVVGKPKVKGKEKEQKEFHNREHGKKFHPHHQKRNY